MYVTRLSAVLALLFAHSLYCQHSFQQGPETLWFEQNIGQTGPQAQYLARTRQATVFVTNSDTVYSLRGPGAKRATVRMELVGSTSGQWSPTDHSSRTVDSYVGPPGKWRRNIPTAARLRRPSVYPGIDLVYYGNGRQLEYDFELTRASNVKRIRIRFNGAASTRITPAGDLEIVTSAGTLIHQRPRVFQHNAPVQARYHTLRENEFEIRLGPHNPSQPLTIDPVVNFTRFYSGEADDVITAMSGAAIAGYTNSIDFPGATSAASGGYDAFFATVGADQRISYVGGSGDDKAWSVYVGPGVSTQQTYAIAGETNSPDFPTFLNTTSELLTGPGPSRFGLPFQSKYGGGKSDGFIFWVGNTNQGWIVHSTFAGGAGDDRVLSINGSTATFTAVGETDSTDFPVSSNAPQPRLAGGKDGFYLNVTFSNGITALGTYFGGSADDSLTRINSNLLASGVTRSDDLPLTNPTQSQRGGGQDAFLLQLLPATTNFRTLFASYLGGSGDDEITALRQSTRWVAVGTTTSPDFPGADPAQFHGGADGFLCEFAFPQTDTPGGVIKTTFIGGSGNDSLRDAIATPDALLFVGATNSTDLAVKDPLQPAYGGGPSDAFFGIFTRDGEIPFLTYFGGEGSDEAVGAGADLQSRWLIAGNSSSAPGRSDGFVMQFSAPNLPLTASYAVHNGVTFASLSPIALPEKSVPVTIRSADPSRLLLAHMNSPLGQETLQFDWDGSASFFFQLWGLARSGSVDLIASAPGLSERRVSVPLLPPTVRISVSGLGAADPDGIYRLPSNGTSVRFTVRPYVAADLPGAVFPPEIDYPRPGLPPQTLELLSSDAKVVVFTPASYLLRAGANRLFVQQNATPRVAGQTQLSARLTGSLGSRDSPAVPFVLEGPRIRPTLLSAAVGLYLPGFVSLGITPPVALTITSVDPGVALVAASPADPPSPSITLPLAGPAGQDGRFFVVGLSTGANARLRFSAPGFEDAILERPVQRPAFGLLATIPPSLNVGDEYRFAAFVGPNDPNNGLPPFTGSLAANPFRFQLTSSDPAVLEVTPSAFTLQPGESEVPFTLRARKPGAAVLSLTSDAIADPIPARTRVAVNVTSDGPPASLSLFPLRLGKDLQAPLQFRVPSNLSGPVTLTSADPSRLLVSSSSTTLGAATATGSAFWLQALSGEGSVTLTASVGGSTATTTVDLVPSYGAVLPAAALTTNAFTPIEFSVQTFPAVPANFIVTAGQSTFAPAPVNQYRGQAAQSPRPGLAPLTFRAESSNPAVGAIRQTQSVFRFEPAAVGETILTLTAEGPIELDPRSRSIRITATPVTPVINGSVMPKDAQSSLLFFLPNIASSGATEYTLTSSDPSKLLIADAPDGPGRPTVQPRGPAYLQAVGDPGIAYVSLTSSLTAPVSARFTLTPSAIAYRFQVNPSLQPIQGSELLDEPITVALGRQAGELSFGLTDASGQSSILLPTRPGVTASVRLEVSPPGALELSATEFIIGRSPIISIIPRRPGDAKILVVPAGPIPMLTNSRELRFTVTP